MTSLSELGAAGRAMFHVRTVRPYVNEFEWKTRTGTTKKGKNFNVTIVGQDPEEYALAVVSTPSGIQGALSKYVEGHAWEISRVQMAKKDHQPSVCWRKLARKRRTNKISKDLKPSKCRRWTKRMLKK